MAELVAIMMMAEDGHDGNDDYGDGGDDDYGKRKSNFSDASCSFENFCHQCRAKPDPDPQIIWKDIS